jgi:hypothetical protein
MKKRFLVSIFTVLCIAFSQVSHAQHFYVKVRPVEPVIVRPAAPSPHHVWVEHEWAWRNGAYVHVPGYWVVPPRGHHRWIPGHWRESRRDGAYWVPGHWS